MGGPWDHEATRGASRHHAHRIGDANPRGGAHDYPHAPENAPTQNDQRAQGGDTPPPHDDTPSPPHPLAGPSARATPRRGGGAQWGAPWHARRCTRAFGEFPGIPRPPPPGWPPLLVLGWGSTHGAIHAAVDEVNAAGKGPVAQAHLTHLNPFPKNLGAGLSRYKTGLVLFLLTI